MGVAIINRSATRSCSSFYPPRVVYDGSGRSGCELFKAAFAVAILAIVSSSPLIGVEKVDANSEGVGSSCSSPRLLRRQSFVGEGSGRVILAKVCLFGEYAA